MILLGWTAAVAFDTGWVRSSPWSAETPQFSQQFDVPCAPPQASVARLHLSLLQYRQNIQAINVGPEPAFLGGNGTYCFNLSHTPYVWVHDQIVDGGPWLSLAFAPTAGGGGTYLQLWPGQSSAYEGLTTFQTNMTELCWVDAFERSRDGISHGLWFTPVGNYTMGYGWLDGTPPPGYGGHSPISYTRQEECRAVGTVEYLVP